MVPLRVPIDSIRLDFQHKSSRVENLAGRVENFDSTHGPQSSRVESNRESNRFDSKVGR